MSIHIGITETKCESQWNLKTTPHKIAIPSIENTKPIEANRVTDCGIRACNSNTINRGKQNHRQHALIRLRKAYVNKHTQQ